MAQPAKPQTPTPSPAPTPAEPPYPRIYAWLFQSWLIMFLFVICGALIFYLLSYFPKL